jgi:hypothetical protein
MYGVSKNSCAIGDNPADYRNHGEPESKKKAIPMFFAGP